MVNGAKTVVGPCLTNIDSLNLKWGSLKRGGTMKQNVLPLNNTRFLLFVQKALLAYCLDSFN